MTEYSLMQIISQPRLVEKLSEKDFKILWELAVKVAGEYSALCHDFEKDFLRRHQSSFSDETKSDVKKE